ncbi:sensor histidine kinase [Georgenia subflava]|uniref:Two-component sensor histidine kinase n=1 Tax=Georgenia subflava TaxID=1622177 RepID=A0A6N7EEC3_9MICO|nr:sensor histidine kinase [Georgenia subflava]MPV36370.1 two-component sensor histidine kinase [Georgenia subflava]
MASRAQERLSAGAGLAAVLVVGLSVLLYGVPVGDSAAAVALWWVGFAVYVLTFAADSEIFGLRTPWPDAVTVAVLTVSGLTLWLLAPHLGWTALLFVVTTAAAAYVLVPRVVGALVVLQTVAVAVGGAMAGLTTDNVVFATLAYLAFQVFAALVVVGTRREAEARAALAVAHADLRAATALLATSSRNDERVRIARDLHDVVGHQLTALALELEVAAHRATGDGAEHVARARGIAKDLLADVRATVGELRDAPAGLEPTLRGIVEHVPGLAVELEVDERRPLDDAATIAVVRCVQEIVTNTVRHAGAAHLQVAVVSDDDGLRLRAHDDGVGVRAVEPGNGLTGMAERFEELGGELSLDSVPGRGFTVRARVPAR